MCVCERERGCGARSTRERGFREAEGKREKERRREGQVRGRERARVYRSGFSCSLLVHAVEARCIVLVSRGRGDVRASQGLDPPAQTHKTDCDPSRSPEIPAHPNSDPDCEYAGRLRHGVGLAHGRRQVRLLRSERGGLPSPCRAIRGGAHRCLLDGLVSRWFPC